MFCTCCLLLYFGWFQFQSSPINGDITFFSEWLTPRGSPLTSKIVWPVSAGLDVKELINGEDGFGGHILLPDVHCTIKPAPKPRLFAETLGSKSCVWLTYEIRVRLLGEPVSHTYSCQPCEPCKSTCESHSYWKLSVLKWVLRLLTLFISAISNGCLDLNVKLTWLAWLVASQIVQPLWDHC